MSEGDSTRATTASIDKRVERLEERFDSLQQSHNEMGRKIDRLELAQSHMKDLMDARFSIVDRTMESQSLRMDSFNSKLDLILNAIQAQNNESIKMASNPESSPAGRTLLKLVESVQENQNTTDSKIEGLEKKVWVAVGVISSVVFLVNLFGPAILGLVGLPH